MQICACMHTPQPHESNEDRRREEERWTPINLQSIQKLSPMNQLDDIFWHTEKKNSDKVEATASFADSRPRPHYASHPYHRASSIAAHGDEGGGRGART